MSENISKAEILKQFTIKNPEQVEDYLTQYPFLESVLQEAYAQTQALFPDAEIELKLVHDYEIPDDKILVIYIWANMAIDEAWERLRHIEDDWYLKLPNFIREKLNIDVR